MVYAPPVPVALTASLKILKNFEVFVIKSYTLEFQRKPELNSCNLESNKREGLKMATQWGNQSTSASNPQAKSQGTQPAQPQERQVEFSLSAPQAKTVSVAGTFNRWNPAALSLKKDFQGNWKGFTSLKPGRYQYRLVVDGKWTDDPKARETVPNEFGSRNAVLDLK